MSDPINDKINNLESRFEKHAASMETKMTEMVRLMTTVATLQERDTRHEDNILEMRKFHDSMQISFKDSIERVHARLDSIDQSQAQRYVVWRADMDKNRAELENLVWREKEHSHNELHKTSTKLGDLSETVKEYINKAKGVWIAGILGLSLIQFIGGYVINMIREDYKTYQTTVQEINTRLSENEKTTLQLWQTIRQNQK